MVARVRLECESETGETEETVRTIRLVRLVLMIGRIVYVSPPPSPLTPHLSPAPTLSIFWS